MVASALLAKIMVVVVLAAVTLSSPLPSPAPIRLKLSVVPSRLWSASPSIFSRRYALNVAIGTPPQPVSLALDSSTSTLSLLSRDCHRSSLLDPGTRCAPDGFIAASSTSFSNACTTDDRWSDFGSKNGLKRSISDCNVSLSLLLDGGATLALSRLAFDLVAFTPLTLNSSNFAFSNMSFSSNLPKTSAALLDSNQTASLSANVSFALTYSLEGGPEEESVEGSFGLAPFTEKSVSLFPSPLKDLAIDAYSLCLGESGGVLSLLSGPLASKGDPALSSPNSAPILLGTLLNGSTLQLSGIAVRKLPGAPNASVPVPSPWSSPLSSEVLVLSSPVSAVLGATSAVIALPPSLFRFALKQIPCQLGDNCDDNGDFDPTKDCYGLNADDLAHFPTLSLAFLVNGSLTWINLPPSQYLSARRDTPTCLAFTLVASLSDSAVLGLPLLSHYALTVALADGSVRLVRADLLQCGGEFRVGALLPVTDQAAATVYLALCVLGLGALAVAAYLAMLIRRRCKRHDPALQPSPRPEAEESAIGERSGDGDDEAAQPFLVEERESLAEWARRRHAHDERARLGPDAGSELRSLGTS